MIPKRIIGRLWRKYYTISQKYLSFWTFLFRNFHLKAFSINLYPCFLDKIMCIDFFYLYVHLLLNAYLAPEGFFLRHRHSLCWEFLGNLREWLPKWAGERSWRVFLCVWLQHGFSLFLPLQREKTAMYHGQRYHYIPNVRWNCPRILQGVWYSRFVVSKKDWIDQSFHFCIDNW